MKELLIINLFLLFLLSSCYYDVEELLYPEEGACFTGEVSYTLDILPLLESKCLICHNQNSQITSINLQSYDALVNYIENGRFFGSISHAPGYNPMPQGGARLPDCELEKVQSWIQNGYPNN